MNAYWTASRRHNMLKCIALNHVMNEKILSRVRVHRTQQDKRTVAAAEAATATAMKEAAAKRSEPRKLETKCDANVVVAVGAASVVVAGRVAAWICCPLLPVYRIIYFILLCAANSLWKGFNQLLYVVCAKVCGRRQYRHQHQQQARNLEQASGTSRKYEIRL